MVDAERLLSILGRVTSRLVILDGYAGQDRADERYCYRFNAYGHFAHETMPSYQRDRECLTRKIVLSFFTIFS